MNTLPENIASKGPATHQDPVASGVLSTVLRQATIASQNPVGSAAHSLAVRVLHSALLHFSEDQIVSFLDWQGVPVPEGFQNIPGGPAVGHVARIAEVEAKLERLQATHDEALAVLRRFVALLPSGEGLGGHAPIGAFVIVGDAARRLL